MKLHHARRIGKRKRQTYFNLIKHSNPGLRSGERNDGSDAVFSKKTI